TLCWQHALALASGGAASFQSLDRRQESGGTLTNLTTVRRAFFGRLAEVEPNVNARRCVLVRRLGEAGIGTEHRRRIIAGSTGRKRHAAVLKADLIGAENLFQHLSPH